MSRIEFHGMGSADSKKVKTYLEALKLKAKDQPWGKDLTVAVYQSESLILVENSGADVFSFLPTGGFIRVVPTSDDLYCDDAIDFLRTFGVDVKKGSPEKSLPPK